ncbi:prolyl-tRNA synthetase associated domain-containing protein [Crassaminicella profunda]|uniref:prolyl-tRNA synthetase associated domain-containing protein n=1 Tax=Crassaminicella profunda TaxID=1286698 RepID=UPI001CA66E10|nr:prolyl-tRNA synthetase associated domain-containing protein [Crassaminicella profunda]QZY56378.1 prolyl-tRNA synthetase associated domain-containing protein [Crassaminicella profunda]
MDKEQKVYDLLEELKIAYDIYEHKPIFTIEEANQLNIDIPGSHCKNLFIRNRKGNQHYLVILMDSKKVDLKSLSKQISSTNLSFASEERLLKYLNLTPGAVTPFGLMNDNEKHVEVLVDKDLIDSEYICFHPNVNTATISIAYKDFEKFLRWCENKVFYVEIP